MQPKTLIPLVLILFLTACNADTASDHYQEADSTTSNAQDELQNLNPGDQISILDENDYMCSFSKGMQPISVEFSSTTPADSTIDKRFLSIWEFVLGNEPDDISVYADADQANAVYQYACAYADITSAGRIRNFIRYKIDGIKQLLPDSNRLLFLTLALHEFKHLNAAHSFSPLTLAARELGADSYAGFMLGKYFNVPRDSVAFAFEQLTMEHPIDGYPDRSARVAAATHGWDKSQLSPGLSLALTLLNVKGESHGLVGGNDAWEDYSSLTQAINFNKSDQQIPLSQLFNKLQRVSTEASSSPGNFYLDSNFLYVSINDTLSPVGTVIPSNRKEYRKMIVDSLYNYLYIDDQNPQLQQLLNLDIIDARIQKVTRVGSIIRQPAF